MSRKPISESVKKQLYAESMGRCMNPACRCDLFDNGKDIGEMAHIIPYCETEDNSEENLIILCPNCHKKFDKQETIKEEKEVTLITCTFGASKRLIVKASEIYD